MQVTLYIIMFLVYTACNNVSFVRNKEMLKQNTAGVNFVISQIRGSVHASFGPIWPKYWNKIFLQLRQEKVELEQTLEKEQEYQVNKLMRKIEKLEADTISKQATLEQVREIFSCFCFILSNSLIN